MTPLTPSRLVVRVGNALADLEPGALVLAAVSGGADSTALLHLLARALPPRGLRLGVLHLDHGLRPESAEDRRFVVELAGELGLACRVESADVRALARERGLGLEEAGREARHRFFARAAAELGAAAVALAHTRDDLAESLLLGLVRGSGRAGLAAGSGGRKGLIRRPLGEVGRAELRQLLAELGARFREDPSNLDLRFARNRVRHQVMPALLGINPRAPEALARAAAILAAEDALLDGLAATALADDGPGLSAAALAGLPPALARRVALRALRAACGRRPDLGHEHVDALLALARGWPGAAAALPGGRRAERRGDRILFLARANREQGAEPWERALRVPGETALPEAGLVVRARAVGGDEPLRAQGAAVTVAAAALARPLALRTPRPGDRFRPLGSPGSRPLGRYLGGRGVPCPLRDRAPLLVAGDAILWVLGHQLAEAGRVRPGEPAVILEAVAVER